MKRTCNLLICLLLIIWLIYLFNKNRFTNKLTPKVAVVMWYDDNIKEYGDIAYKINKVYCDKYGIDLIRDNVRRIPKRAQSFEKLLLISEHIRDYDYIIWIDADAFFYIDSPNIIDIINEYSNYDLIFSQDRKKLINSGIFIVKNTDYSIKFLKEWLREDLYENNQEMWENGIIDTMWEMNMLDIHKHGIILKYGILQHFFTEETGHPFILHIPNANNEQRIKIIGEYYNKMLV